MKTVIQIIIEQRNKLSQNDFDTWILSNKKELLEKEKEQSINLIKQTCIFMGASIIDIEISKMEFEDIYNNYYNQ